MTETPQQKVERLTRERDAIQQQLAKAIEEAKAAASKSYGRKRAESMVRLGIDGKTVYFTMHNERIVRLQLAPSARCRDVGMLHAVIADAIDEARTDMRERCAHVVELSPSPVRNNTAAAIRDMKD